MIGRRIGGDTPHETPVFQAVGGREGEEVVEGEWREFDEVGTDGAPPRTPVVAGVPRAGGGDFNGKLVVYRGGAFGIICRR